MAEKLRFERLFEDVDVDQYGRGFNIYLERLGLSMPEFAFREYHYWQPEVEQAEAEIGGPPLLLGVMHERLNLRNFAESSDEQQLRDLAWWDKTVNKYLDYKESEDQEAA
jgi:hypothetical protein